MSEKNEQFPNGLEAFFLWIALVALYTVGYAALSDMHLGLDPYQLNALNSVLANGVLFTIVMHHKGLSYGALFHGSASRTSAGVLFLLAPAVLLMPALMMALSVLSDTVLQIFPMSASDESLRGFMEERSYALVLIVCVLAPILEEMLYRGIVLRSFLRQYPRWTAIVGSATLFGFVHMNLYQFIDATIFGVLAGWMYQRSQSLIPGIAMHFINNAAVTAWSWHVFPGAATWQAQPALAWIGALLLASCGAGLLYWIQSATALPVKK